MAALSAVISGIGSAAGVALKPEKITAMATSLSAVQGLVGGIFGLVTSIFGALMSASKMLSGTAGRLMNILMMFLKPIGDFISALLEPLIIILQPLAKALNMFLKPFITEYRNYLRKEVKEKGIGAFADPLLGLKAAGAGLSAMGEVFGKPIIEAVIDGIAGGITFIIDVVAGMMNFINNTFFGALEVLATIMKAQMENIINIVEGVLIGMVDVLTPVFAMFGVDITGIKDIIKDKFGEARKIVQDTMGEDTGVIGVIRTMKTDTGSIINTWAEKAKKDVGDWAIDMKTATDNTQAALIDMVHAVGEEARKEADNIENRLREWDEASIAGAARDFIGEEGGASAMSAHAYLTNQLNSRGNDNGTTGQV